jgi:OFA family oxalate/formate antiporter-like MFS transporter
MTGDPSSRKESGNSRRWLQLTLGVLCMTMIANLQYGWTLFVNPIHDRFGWDRSAIQIAFSIFIVMETWLVPFEGLLEDMFGPQPLVFIGGILVGFAWVMNAQLESLPALYFAQAIGGIGAGAVYGVCVGNALKWFPDRRGLAAGLTAAGFGMGSALTIVPISNAIAWWGYDAAFLIFGLLQGIVICSAALGLRSPDEPHQASLGARESYRRRDYTPVQMVRAPVFWLMYAMFVMMASGGLMATAQLAPIAKDFGVADAPVSIFGLTLPALTFALSIDRILNGITRPFFGWVSDIIGRETTMFIAFGLEGLAILALRVCPETSRGIT